MLVNYVLTGKMDGYDLKLDNPKFRKYCCCLDLPSKGGRVGSISGIDNILKNMKSLIAFDKMYDVGDYIEVTGTLRQVHLKFLFIEDTMQELKNSIKQIQDTVKVIDDKGNNMLLPPFNSDRIQISAIA